jgi:hypothetical protein
MKKTIPYLIIAILVLVIILLLSRKNKSLIFSVPIPVVSHSFEVIKNPVPTVTLPGQTIVDSTYYDKYMSLVNNTEKDSLYKESVTLREYNEVFEDSIQTIKAYSKVRGWLTEQSVSYETKERNIITEVTIPTKYNLFIGGGIGVPMKDNSSMYQAGLMLQNKKGNLLNVETDHKLERVYVKYYYKFW